MFDKRSEISCQQMVALKEKWSHFDLKTRVTGGTKIRPGITSNWRIFELNSLDQIDNFRVNLTQIFSNY